MIFRFESFVSRYADVSNLLRRDFRTVFNNLRSDSRWFSVGISSVKGGYLDETDMEHWSIQKYFSNDVQRTDDRPSTGPST